MPTLSVDLAFKDYRDIGVVTLAKVNSRIKASAVALTSRALHGRPSAGGLADALVSIANEISAAWVFIDGPQGWKAPDNGCEHSRVCEHALATQGKTGLPGVTKPGNYAGFITFAIELFGPERWPRLRAPAVPPSRRQSAIESFPTSAWRSLGLLPLPGKAATAPEMVLARLQSLRAVFPLDVSNDLSHDELQALVAGLAGVALDDGNAAGVSIAGVPPMRMDGTWREGFIVNPTRKLLASHRGMLANTAADAAR
jgi:hypothetical protein